ncbi:MAG: aminoacyl-tRNA hydrolase [Myxococcales bacterium]|nr:aminoacyl-tRNA hydrolase [Myxococcales bacterium]
MSRTLIVGLGNPGPRYVNTRHNVGFMVVDRLADDGRIDVGRSKFKALYGAGELEGQKIVCLKPQTFMNLSGQSVVPARQFFDVDVDRIWVVHDELDLPYGTVRLKIGGGHAGHNGLRSIVQQLGSRDFVRLRVGIGRPVHGSVSDYVLSDFAAGDERSFLPDLIERSVAALRLALREGPKNAMNQVNAPSD